MVERSLEGVASFVRDLGSACSAVQLVGDMLLAGSHDGLLLCLDAASGGERWRLQVDGPVSDLALDGERIYATASASLHAVDAAGGELLWSRELEGASDYVQAWDVVVWATSSVYELEVADSMLVVMNRNAGSSPRDLGMSAYTQMVVFCSDWGDHVAAI
jgi:outer membrane protein assembly factor BamB